ncbi:MAG TPA: DUF1326 domain-containing protein [Candidatus Binataceae bacterium]|nr:DUF1326 domain-containing protein [Candidatus Binataceae bacterium]
MSIAKQPWKIQGEYFESCNCEVLCPCILSNMQARPTEGHCDVVLAFRIDKGNFGSIDISGLNAVQVLTTPGPMAQGNATLGVYVDSRGSSDQRAALEAIFSGAAGGPPALFGPMVTKALPCKAVEINFAMHGNERKLVIPGITEVTVKGIAGRGGKDVVWLENTIHPYSGRLAAAKGEKSDYKDHSLDFHNSGRNGHYAGIDWTSS